MAVVGGKEVQSAGESDQCTAGHSVSVYNNEWRPLLSHDPSPKHDTTSLHQKEPTPEHNNLLFFHLLGDTHVAVHQS